MNAIPTVLHIPLTGGHLRLAHVADTTSSVANYVNARSGLALSNNQFNHFTSLNTNQQTMPAQTAKLESRNDKLWKSAPP